jgi:hypothetical protein
MSSGFWEAWPWNRFMEFVSLEIDRFAMMNQVIKEAGLQYTINAIEGNRHFFIVPPPFEEKNRRMTILVAHYDRSPGSPGANDNSAAVFILIETAMKLIKDRISNWLIIFTDKEELSGGEGIEEQGAYSLGLDLRKTEMASARIFIFDACGVGDTIIISTTADYFLKNESGGEKMRNSIRELRENALVAVRNLTIGKAVLAPTPFSDDLGFLRAGIAAQTITMLPTHECNSLISIARRDSRFPEILVNQNRRSPKNMKKIPATWRNINTPRDSYVMLTPGNFRYVTRFIDALCR